MNSDQHSTEQSPMGSTAVQAACESPRVPVVVRAWCLAIMVLSAIYMGLQLFIALSLLLQLTDGLSKALALIYLLYLLIGLIGIVWFMIGKGLRAGERQAVYGLCILGGLAVLLAPLAVASDPVTGFVLLVLIAVLHVPPIVSAFRHWTAFK